jgi:pimeloyl-ACP methyl ester carboxylesterase
VPYDEIGRGPAVLCLPAPSTISTRDEMRHLAERLANSRRVVRVDWPGLGEADRERILYRPSLYARFLAAFIERFREPVAVVAAGHAASYVLGAPPERFSRLVLLAPTWRGPLPTVMGPHRRAWAMLETVVHAPVVGPLLYGLNSTRGFIRWMMRRHVYADEAHISDGLLDARVRTAHRRNARFAAAAFVTGGLDLFHSREGFLAAARASPAPVFVAIGEKTPPKSLSEMRALAELPTVKSTTIRGSLAFYDEYPDETATAVAAFLDGS